MSIIGMLKQFPKNNTNPPKNAMEMLTTELTEETTLKLDEQFAAMISPFDARSHPVGVNDVKTVFFSLLAVAVAQRHLLAGRLERSIDSGDLFAQYEAKLQAIDALTENARAAGQRLAQAQKEYAYAQALYENATGKTYLTEIQPDDLPNDPIPYNPWLSKEMNEKKEQTNG